MVKQSETIGKMLSRIRPGAYPDLDPEICAASREKLIAFAELADRREIERESARKHRPVDRSSPK